MSGDFQKDELRIGQYDAAEAEAKKKKILKRVGIGIGVAVLLAVLGYFGLVGAQDKNGPDTSQPMTEFMLGGNGAWFNSVIVFFGG